MNAISAGLAAGESTISYKIGDMEHTVVPSDELLEKVSAQYDKACMKVDRANKGWLRVAKVNRASGIGLS